MTPKEKCLELIEKFKIYDYDWIAQGNDYCVKQYALIAVNEILNTLFTILDALPLHNEVSYWEQVIIEIEKC
jgi:hypothetical protein